MHVFDFFYIYIFLINRIHALGKIKFELPTTFLCQKHSSKLRCYLKVFLMSSVGVNRSLLLFTYYPAVNRLNTYFLTWLINLYSM